MRVRVDLARWTTALLDQLKELFAQQARPLPDRLRSVSIRTARWPRCASDQRVRHRRAPGEPLCGEMRGRWTPVRSGALSLNVLMEKPLMATKDSAARLERAGTRSRGLCSASGGRTASRPATSSASRAKSPQLRRDFYTPPGRLAAHATGAPPAAALHAGFRPPAFHRFLTNCTATAPMATIPRWWPASRASTAGPCSCIGQQKGRDTKQRVAHNFGQAKPEGYRKALRVMQLAAKFGRPDLHVHRYARAPIPASTPKSAARPKPSPTICARWRACPCPSS